MKYNIKNRKCKRCAQYKPYYHYFLENLLCDECIYDSGDKSIKLIPIELFEELKEFIYYMKDKNYWAEKTDLFKLTNISCEVIPYKIHAHQTFEETFYYICKFLDIYKNKKELN